MFQCATASVVLLLNCALPSDAQGNNLYLPPKDTTTPGYDYPKPGGPGPSSPSKPPSKPQTDEVAISIKQLKNLKNKSARIFLLT